MHNFQNTSNKYNLSLFDITILIILFRLRSSICGLVDPTIYIYTSVVEDYKIILLLILRRKINTCIEIITI